MVRTTCQLRVSEANTRMLHQWRGMCRHTKIAIIHWTDSWEQLRREVVHGISCLHEKEETDIVEMFCETRLSLQELYQWGRGLEEIWCGNNSRKKYKLPRDVFLVPVDRDNSVWVLIEDSQETS